MVRNKKKYWVLLPNSLLTVCWQCADRYSSKITPKYVKQYSFAAGSVKVRLVDTFVRECCFNFSLFILWPETRYYFHFPELTINTHKTFLSYFYSILNKLNKKQKTKNKKHTISIITMQSKRSMKSQKELEQRQLAKKEAIKKRPGGRVVWYIARFSWQRRSERPRWLRETCSVVQIQEPVSQSLPLLSCQQLLLLLLRTWPPPPSLSCIPQTISLPFFRTNIESLKLKP